MPKLNLRTALRIRAASGEVMALKGAGFDWVKPAAGPVVTLVAPTFSDDFTYADGTRLVAGDPNDNYGLGTGNPGNLGWDALTDTTATNARFNTVVFGGQLRIRTASAIGDNTQPGTYFMSPPVTQGGDMYAQFTTPALASASDALRVGIQGTGQTQRLEVEYTHTSGITRLRQVDVPTTTGAIIASVTPVASGRRLGGLNGNLRFPLAEETITLLAVDGRAYIRRGPGFPVGLSSGNAIPTFSGDRFGMPTVNNRGVWIDNLKVGPAPMFITVDETHRYWVPKKRASASDPITAGAGDETFTGTYVGTIPSRMQWALFDMGTGATIKDWALVPDADFTASAGTWSARLRSIPAGLNGRSAYGVGFRPVDATDQTDPAWQVVSNREFYVTLNVGCIGQSNSVSFTSTSTGTDYPRVDGLMTYTKADPPSLTPGLNRPTPEFWSHVATLSTRCTHVLGEYLGNLYDLPISFEVLAIAARGAPVLGPIDAVTGLPHPSSNWDYIQTHHAFAGGAYEILYLSQGENEFAAGADVWAQRWEANLDAYRDPSMHGQPAGTVIPTLLAMTGRNTGTLLSDANANLVRQQQLQLAATVDDVYMAHSYTGVEMADAAHYVTTFDEGYNEVARRLKLTYDHLFNSGAYDGRGPIATSATRSGAVITVAFALNGADSLTTRNGTDQTLAGTASALTSWEVSDDDFATTLAISSAVQTGNTVVITLSADPGGPVKVRNHYGQNADISSYPAGEYTDGTFICMMPLANPLTTST